MANRLNRTTKQARDGQVIVGIKKDLQSVTSIPLDGDTYTPTSLVAFIQSRIDSATKVATAKAAWIDATTQYDTIDTKATAVVSGLKQYVMNAFGKTSPLLADFGFSPRKVTVLTPEQKQQAVAKRAATRAARGTKGPVAKLAVTGETVKLAALEAAAARNAAPANGPSAAPAAGPPAAPADGPSAAPAAAPTAAPAPAPAPAPVPAPTVAPAPAPQPAPANGAPPQTAAPPKA